jgi:hypothetical protein
VVNTNKTAVGKHKTKKALGDPSTYGRIKIRQPLKRVSDCGLDSTGLGEVTVQSIGACGCCNEPMASY